MRVAIVALSCAMMLAASCGGPYTPKRTNLPGEKLALANGIK